MYRAPVSDIAFTLKHVAGLGEALAAGAFPGLTEDDLDAVLAEAGRFASEALAPLNAVGDRQGARLDDGAVATPPGWREAYAAWRAAGWNGIAAPQAHGGQGLPLALSAATQEMWNGACMAFALCPMLTMGAVEALARHGSAALRALYLPRMVSGEWTATMNLTEPQAGSDLGAVAARAERRPERRDDGSYRLFGQKIFITYGEHDLSENIVHLVLARLPDAPKGSRGISLFLVPKRLVGPDGAPGERNDVVCAGLERKLGIHGSPTCTMIYGGGRFEPEGGPGAIGWLVGEEHRGLAAMFTMMNNARLMVGVQGVGQAERALQQAAAYAHARRQGRAPSTRSDGPAPIAAHPDIRRLLLTMRALTRAARALCYTCAVAADLGARDAAMRARAELLTPVAKAFATDVGVEVASLAIQVHGGAGYIEETGAAQTLRDARIAPIYEGTNGIQAIDLVTRKLPMEDGAVAAAYIAALKEIAARARGDNRPGFARMGGRLDAALANLEAATAHLLACQAEGRTDEALASATPYLRLFGLAAGGASLVKAALAGPHPESGPHDTDSGSEAEARAALARFHADNLLPETAALLAAVTDGGATILAADC